MQSLPFRMQGKLHGLVTGLVKGDYKGLERRGQAGLGGAEGLRDAIEQYPGQITMPPSWAFEQIRQWWEIEWDHNNERTRHLAETERTWTLVFTLWYDDEESDLTLEATYHEPFGGEPWIEVEMIKS
jgi:hypothetical protein